MKRLSWSNLYRSMLRIASALAVVIGIPALGYLVWQPGDDKPFSDLAGNAIWIGHGWLGDDGWFERNRRDPAKFRDEKEIAALFRKLREHKISVVYPHLCPAQYSGSIAPYDDAQIERFLDLAESYGIAVIPWIGGVFRESARLADGVWRKNFVSSVKGLLKKHPRLAGVQVNIEPLPSGNTDFLKMLDELRPAVTGKILGVAAYPPPTLWQSSCEIHWEASYIESVADRCDELTVMMYDTAIPLEKFYIRLMTDWTRELADALRRSRCRLILGIPAYEDADVGYHHPRVENISSALRGIAGASRNDRIGGLAIYCEWEMNDAKWRRWDEFVR